MRFDLLVGFGSATLVLILAVVPVPAQSAGIISGTLSDETRAVLPGVTVEATHAATGTTRSAVTGADGHYRLVGLTLESMKFALP